MLKFLLKLLTSFNKRRDTDLPKPFIGPLVLDDERPIEELPAQKIKTAEELEGEQIMSLLIKGQTNPADSEATKRLRKFINYEFKFPDDTNFNKTHLQCTEYVQFKVLKELKIKINWIGRIGPRHGATWPNQFLALGRYNVLDVPKRGCAMSFSAGCPVPPGHIAFVEEAFLPDNSLRISEANWDEKGSYQERKLTQKEWKDYYKGRFIDFS